MKKIFVIAALFGASCSKPAPVNPASTNVYLELVEAGCLAQDDAGPAEIAQEEALGSDSGFPWLACLFDGGSISGCGVPCSGPINMKKH